MPCRRPREHPPSRFSVDETGCLPWFRHFFFVFFSFALYPLRYQAQSCYCCNSSGFYLVWVSTHRSSSLRQNRCQHGVFSGLCLFFVLTAAFSLLFLSLFSSCLNLPNLFWLSPGCLSPCSDADGLTDYGESEVFQDDWFGEASPNNEFHTVDRGRWAYTPVMRASTAVVVTGVGCCSRGSDPVARWFVCASDLACSHDAVSTCGGKEGHKCAPSPL